MIGWGRFVFFMGGMYVFISITRKNKMKFLELCVHAVLSNGVFVSQEKDMISVYCREMNIEESFPEINNNFEEFIEDFSKTLTFKEKKIIILETLSIVRADGIYDKSEKKFMEFLVNKFEMSTSTLDNCIRLLDEYQVISLNMNIYISN